MLLHLLLASLTFAPVPSPQGADDVHDLRRRAQELLREGKKDQAFNVQREAALIALAQGRPQLQARCLIELAAIEGSANEDPWDHAFDDLEHARKLAVMTGRLDLEAEAVEALSIAGDWGVTDLQRLDSAVVRRDFGALESLWSRLRFEESTEAVAWNALKAADLMAEARLSARGAKDVEAATALAGAAEKLTALGFELCALQLLEEALARDERLVKTLQPAYEKRGDVRGLTLAAIVNAPTDPGEDKRAEVVRSLERAFTKAGELRDPELQIRAATRLHKITGDVRWSGAVGSVRQSQLWELIADARRALRDPFFASHDLTARLEAHRDDKEAGALLALMNGSRQPPEDVKAFREAFKAAIGDAKTLRWATAVAEIAERHEVFPVVVEALKAEAGNPPELAGAVEVLATRDDRAALTTLLGHKDEPVAEAAAAALFRLGADGLEDAVRSEAKRLAEANPPHRLYLLGALARLGDRKSLDDVVAASKLDDVKYSAFAVGILGSLDYGSPIGEAVTMVNLHAESPYVLRALGRMPDTWGQTISTMWDSGAGRYAAARVWGLRKVPIRAEFTSWKDPHALMWALPGPAEAARSYDNFRFNRDIPKIEDPAARDMLGWAAENSGILSNALQPAETQDRDDDPLRRLARAERETRPLPHGENERHLVLVDWGSQAEHARCVVRARTGPALMMNAIQLEIPFKWRHKIDCWAGGLTGALYRDVILRIAEADLIDKIEILLPGREPIPARLQAGKDGWGVVSAELPLKVVGEGLGDDQPIPLETLRQGKLRLTFNFNGNHGRMEFPIRVDVPPDAKKPDLVPVQLALDPAVPDVGENARIFLRVTNKGRSVERDAISSVRFQVHNPQSEQGWVTLDARVLVANGWRAGETRTFEVRPKFVDGYYMNRYSYTYTPAMGDSKLAAVVDPDNAVEEGDEENNRIELEAPLRRSRESGLAMAEAEALAALAAPSRDFAAADTIEKLDAAFDSAVDIIDRMKERTAVIRRLVSTLSETYGLRRAQLRAARAMKELDEARASGGPTKEAARRIRGELMRSQQEILRSGTPVKIETLEKARNATLAAANIPASLGDKDQLLYATNITDTDESAAGDASGPLKAMDAAMLTYLEARRAREEGRVDAGNLMDAIANTADALEAKLPGFGNFQRAVFQAEVEYAEQGLRKEAEAIQALSDVIEAKEGAQERLNAAVGDVGNHVKSGPFTEDSLKNIARGWVKDIPVVGPLADMIFSWK